MADAGDDFMSYASPQLDALVVKARSTVDESKRMPLWHECQKILHEDQPYTFLYTRMSLSFFDKRIQNVKPSKLGLNYISDDTMPMVWWVPLAQQKWK
jgi:peptide/nickel transport system substrate-binding protein